MPSCSAKDCASAPVTAAVTTEERLDGVRAVEFTRLVERWSRLVFSIALRRLDGDREGAQEVAQNVFLTAYRKGHFPQQVKSPAAWFHHLTLLQSANYQRGERRRLQHLEAWAAEQAVHAGDGKPEFPEDLRDQLDDALNLLADAERELVLGRFYEGCAFQELASGRGTTPDAVRVRLNRILEKLAHFLKRRGVAVSIIALSSALGAQWPQAAPAGFTAAVSSTLAATATTFPIPTFVTAMSSAKSLTLTVAALAIGAAGLHSQSLRITDLKNQLAQNPAANLTVVHPSASARTTQAQWKSLASSRRDPEDPWADTGPVTPAKLLRDEQKFGGTGDGRSRPCDQRVHAMSADEMENLLVSLDSVPAGASPKTRTRARLVGFLAAKDPARALSQAKRLRLPAAVYADIGREWAVRDGGSALPELLTWLKNPDALPAGKFGADPAGGFYEGLAVILGEQDIDAAIALAKSTPEATQSMLKGVLTKIIRSGRTEDFPICFRSLPIPRKGLVS